MKNNMWIEVAVYLAIVALGMLAYTAIVKFGVPWYYCTYYSVCFH